MLNTSYEGIKENTSQSTMTSHTSIQIINAPNGIPSLGISLTANTKTGKLTVEDLIERVKERFASLGLTKEFPATLITILINSAPYTLSNKTTEIQCNGNSPNIRIMFPKVIDKQFLPTQRSANELTSLTGKEKPKGLFSGWFS